MTKVCQLYYSLREVIITTVLKGFDQKNSWFKFNNLGMAIGIALIFYTSVVKRLKLKVRKFLGIAFMSVEIKKEKLVRNSSLPSSPD